MTQFSGETTNEPWEQTSTNSHSKSCNTGLDLKSIKAILNVAKAGYRDLKTRKPSNRCEYSGLKT